VQPTNAPAFDALELVLDNTDGRFERSPNIAGVPKGYQDPMDQTAIPMVDPLNEFFSTTGKLSHGA